MNRRGQLCVEGDHSPFGPIRTRRACLPLRHILTWNCRGLLLSWPTCLYPVMLLERCRIKPSAWRVKGVGTSVFAAATEGLQGGCGAQAVVSRRWRQEAHATPCASGRAPRTA